ncbi:MAG: hypothetical protein K8W52_26670 [Deltaproteobacteria bacterium]|nr:hypothetical protein [Deltaproteobacteria bacterium]
MNTTRVAIVAAIAAQAACVRQLPPLPTPAPIAPPIATSAPIASGQGRLVIDIVDGPAPVRRILMQPQTTQDAQGRSHVTFGETHALVCAATPCLADVTVGNVLLGFPVIGRADDLEIELVHVGERPTVYRRTLSVYENHTGAVRVLGIIGASVGSASVITGAALLPIGLAKDHDGLTTAGGLTLGVGAAVLALGIWAIRHDAPTFRPASSNHYPL